MGVENGRENEDGHGENCGVRKGAREEEWWMEGGKKRETLAKAARRGGHPEHLGADNLEGADNLCAQLGGGGGR